MSKTDASITEIDIEIEEYQENVSDLFYDKEQMEYVLSVAVEHGVNVEKHFANANGLLGK